MIDRPDGALQIIVNEYEVFIRFVFSGEIFRGSYRLETGRYSVTYDDGYDIPRFALGRSELDDRFLSLVNENKQ